MISHAIAHVVTVRSGDTLSEIASKHKTSVCALASKNRIENPDLIYPGQKIKLAGRTACVSSGLKHYSASYHYVAPKASERHVSAPATTYSASSGMEQCIISRESGGSAQVMNASGHWGLYQFSEGTWVASGGSASDFGHASSAEQHRVFENAVAARGYSDWSSYDGC